MRTLKYAILGLLNKKSMSGYDIAKEFKYELFKFWHANHSQIYPELKRLTTDGFLNFDIELSGEVLEKKIYSITESGKNEFMKWLSIDEDVPKTPKDVFRLRMYYSNNLDLESRILLLENRKIKHQERLKALKKTGEQYLDVPSHKTDRFGDFIVLEGGIMREECSIEWIDKCIGYCKKAQELEGEEL